MKRTLMFGTRARRGAVAVAAVALSILPLTGARADDRIGLVMAASPSGVATRAVTMRIPAEASSGAIPLFISTTGPSTLFSVSFAGTPLRDAEGGVTTITPVFAPSKRTIPVGGEMRRVDVSVSGLNALGNFTSTLYAKNGSRTQTLGTLTVTHTLRSGELSIASIDRASGSHTWPGSAAEVTFLVTVRNAGEREIVIGAPEIERFTVSGHQADRPRVHVSLHDGSVASGRFTVPPRGSVTLRMVLTGIDKTGDFAGTVRVAGEGTEPAEQRFGFDVKDGPLFPALLIALGVLVAFALRWLLSSGAIARAGQQRIAARLLADIAEARADATDLETREKRLLDAFERRVQDVSEELARARSTRRTAVLAEVDAKLDVFADLVRARRLVRAMRPAELQASFESTLAGGVALLAEETPPDEQRLAAAAVSFSQMPAAVAAATYERFRSDVDALIATAESAPTISAALPVRIIERVEESRHLASEGRFAQAHAGIGAAQLAFARALAEDFLARLPEADDPPPGFDTGWQKFRSQIADGLRKAARQRRGSAAADAYRVVWQTYATELAGRLKSAAGRERRGAPPARKTQLNAVVEACEEASSMAVALDASAVEAYARALETYLASGARRSAARVRSELDRSRLPLPLTVIAAGLKDVDEVARAPHDAPSAASSLARQIRRRHVGLALAAGVVAVPCGLALLWAPSETWGTFTDAAAVMGWGFGLTTIAAVADASRAGLLASRDARRSVRRSSTVAADDTTAQAVAVPRATSAPASDV